MIRDLRGILEGWEYEPGRISVRKIIGRDGREKIQTRIDLGVLQMEPDGRPDGKRPDGHDSYYELLAAQLERHVNLWGDDEDFVLTAEDCQELRHEGYLYYQRYLSLFVLEDFARVIADTACSLRLIDFCERYGGGGEDAELLKGQRPYVLMMNARARALNALSKQTPEEALAAVDEGLVSLRRLQAAAAEGETVHELRILYDLRREILGKLPSDSPPRLEWELRCALDCEDYERAAQLRDALAQSAGPGERRCGQRADRRRVEQV